MRTSDQLTTAAARSGLALQDTDELRRQLEWPVTAAVVTLKKRMDRHDRNRDEDDFRVDFKNREALRSAAGRRARSTSRCSPQHAS